MKTKFKEETDQLFERTLLHAAQRECVLAHKVILRCLVIVFHYKAYHGQLRCANGEMQRVIPHGVKPCEKEELLSTQTGSNISHLKWLEAYA